MVDVFISYARGERASVLPIKRLLEARGLTVFFDADGIDGGADFPDVIDAAVKNAKVVLGVWSAAALARPWVRRECRIGQARGVLVPVAIGKIGDLEVPVEFMGTHYYDLSGWTEASESEAFGQALKLIDKLVGRDASGGADRAQNLQPNQAGGSDARFSLTIDFATAVLGGVQRVSFADGSQIDLTIPAGVSAGQVMRVRGHGGVEDGRRGDALIEIIVEEDAFFRREGDDVRTDLNVSIAEAVGGARVPLRTPGGFVVVTVPPRSNTGDVLRLRGRGVKDKGDLLARLLVTLPDGDNTELLQRLSGWSGVNTAPLRPEPPKEG